ncbi:MAG: hypothetical protein LBP24_00275 [Coriobacteriales bacterium]|jgi:uncharacterized protein (DUF697 family)|nr:hypothetical protein [Coriobacteriales bacterium]
MAVQNGIVPGTGSGGRRGIPGKGSGKGQGKGFALPVSPSALLESIGHAEEQSETQYRLAVLVDNSLEPELLAYAKEAFRPQSNNVTLVVEPYADDPVPLASDVALVVLLAAKSRATGRIVLDAVRARLPVVVVTNDPARLTRIACDAGHAIDLELIVAASEDTQCTGTTEGAKDAKGAEGEQASEDTGVAAAREARELRFARLFAALGDWIVRELVDERLALARAFSFVRRPFVEDAILSTSLQNAAIAAVFFLPGADMPLLTLNQVKLFLRIAAAYDAAVDLQRLKELAVLLLSGFGLRALSRRLVGLVPVLGWAVRGTVGYTGTLAIGKAAQEYFERGGSPRLVARSLKSQLDDLPCCKTGKRR